MKIVHKIALNTVGIVLLVVSVTFIGIGLIWLNVSEIVERENPKVQAALEMEINAKEAAKDIMDYLSHGKPEEKDEFKDNIGDFQRFHEQYVEHMRTDEEKKLLSQIDILFVEFKVIAEELFELKDKQDRLIDVRGAILNDNVDVILDDKLGRLAHGNDEKDIAVKEMEINVYELISATRGYLIKGKSFLKDRITDSEQDYNKAEKTYAGLELNAEEQNGFNELKGYWKKIVLQTSEIIRMEDKKRELSKALEENAHKMDYILDEQIQTVAMSKISADETRTLTVISIVLGTTIVICFLAVIVSAYISKRISIPIQELGIAAAKIGKGDLDTHIEIKSKDEIGELAASFNQMTEDLKTTTVSRDKLIASNQQLSASEQQLKASHQQLSASEQQLIASNQKLQAEITERKQAEAVLQKRESELNAIYKNAPLVMLLVDRERRVIKMNKQASLMAQRSMDEATGLRGGEALRCVHAFDDPEGCGFSPACADCGVRNAILSTFQTGEAIYRQEASIPYGDPEDPTEMNILISTTQLSELQEDIVLVCIEDITKRKKLEETQKQQFVQLAHMSRLTTVGEMASGLAHELNQPLCAAINYTNACLHHIKRGDADKNKLVENMKASVEQTERAGEIVNSIKNFVKKHESHKSAIDINDLIRQMPNFIAADISYNKVSFNLSLAEQIPMVLADHVQIEQVLLNLILNCIEAMAGIEVEKRQLTIQTSSTDQGVEIAVSDTGNGVPDEICEKIFNSFFTTKPDGMGIGLSICKTIVESHTGRIWVDRSSKRTTFRFTLPVAGSI